MVITEKSSGGLEKSIIMRSNDATLVTYPDVDGSPVAKGPIEELSTEVVGRFWWPLPLKTEPPRRRFIAVLVYWGTRVESVPAVNRK